MLVANASSSWQRRKGRLPSCIALAEARIRNCRREHISARLPLADCIEAAERITLLERRPQNRIEKRQRERDENEDHADGQSGSRRADGRAAVHRHGHQHVLPPSSEIGGFTEALSGAGYPTVLGMYLFIVGNKMTLNTAPRMLKRGFGILFAKVGFATLSPYRGQVVRRAIWGSALWRFSSRSTTLMAACSGAHQRHGRQGRCRDLCAAKHRDRPFLTMVSSWARALRIFPGGHGSVIAPIAAGAILGNLDDDIREFFGSHEPLIVPFMGFMLGQTINLGNRGPWRTCRHRARRFRSRDHRHGLHRCGQAPGRLGHCGCGRLEHRREFRGCAESRRARRPHLCGDCPAATVQVAASVIVTAILTPMLTAWMYRRVRARAAPTAAEGELATTTPATEAA